MCYTANITVKPKFAKNISVFQILLPDNSLSAYLVWCAANGDNVKYKWNMEFVYRRS